MVMGMVCVCRCVSCLFISLSVRFLFYIIFRVCRYFAYLRICGKPQCFFYSFFTAVISTSILSHTIRFHLFISTYVVKLVAGTIFVAYLCTFCIYSLCNKSI
jgi:hypothetical protein